MPKNKYGFGPFSFKFFVPIRVGLIGTNVDTVKGIEALMLRELFLKRFTSLHGKKLDVVNLVLVRQEHQQRRTYYLVCDRVLQQSPDDMFKKNLNASKPSEHPPQVEECLKV